MRVRMQNKSAWPDELKLVTSEVRETPDGTLVVYLYCIGTKTVGTIDVTIDVRK